MIVIDTNSPEFKKTDIRDLKRARGQLHKLLVESDEVSEHKTPGASEVNRGLHEELEAVQAEIRRKEGAMESEAAVARGIFHAKNGSGEYGAGALLSREQSVRSYLQDSGQMPDRPEFENLRFGALLRAMVTGPKTPEERAALAEGADNTGGITVPTITLARFIDKMRAAQVCVAAGARTLPLTSDQNIIARVLTDPSPAWRAEAGPVAESEPTFDSVTLVPRSLAVLVKASRELIEDSLNIEAALESCFVNSLAGELDRVCLLGTGTPPEPRGIFNTTNVNSLPATGPFTDYDNIVTAMSYCWADNSPTVSGIVISPLNLAILSVLREAANGQYLRKPDVMANTPFFMTSAMNDDTCILGDFSQLIIGIRTQLRIEVLRELFAGNLQYGYIAHLRADVGLEHPQSFCKITNLTTS